MAVIIIIIIIVVVIYYFIKNGKVVEVNESDFFYFAYFDLLKDEVTPFIRENFSITMASDNILTIRGLNRKESYRVIKGNKTEEYSTFLCIKENNIQTKIHIIKGGLIMVFDDINSKKGRVFSQIERSVSNTDILLHIKRDRNKNIMEVGKLTVVSNKAELDQYRGNNNKNDLPPMTIDTFVEITESTNDPQMAYNRGLFLKKHLKYREAVDEFTKAIRLGYKDVYIYHDRALCHLALSNLDLSIKDSSYALSIARNAEEKARALDIRARAFVELKEYDRAFSDLNLSCDLHPSDAISRRGQLYYELKDYRKAISDFEVMTRFFPSSSAFYYYSIGACYGKLNDARNALINYTKAKDLGYTKAEIMIQRINNFMNKNNRGNI